jgi:hypothetical protein
MDSRELLPKIKASLTPEVVAVLMQSLGISDANTKNSFRIRDESTPSCSIGKNCYIKDFGGDFGGDILDFCKYSKKWTFKESLEWVANQLGFDTNNYLAPQIVPIKFQNIKKEESKNSVSLDYIKSKRTIEVGKIQGGLIELFPFIDNADYSLYNANIELLRWSNYDNCLAIDYEEVATVRKSKDGIKWKSFGNKRFIPYRIKDNRIFIVSGMAEALILNYLDVSYIAVQTDSVRIEDRGDLKAKCLGREIIVLQENDESSRKLSKRIVDFFGEAYIIDVGSFYNGVAPKGFDFRDLCNYFKGFDSAMGSIINFLSIVESNKSKKQITHTIDYKGDYIPDIFHIQKGVIVALTGSGKTYSFLDKSDILILVPRVSQTTVYSGDDTKYLIDKIIDSGAVITYDKFIGHYKMSQDFKDLIDNKKFRLIVDEAHILTSIPSKDKKMIYELDALFLSGTIENFFRRDLHHYVFIPEKRKKLYWTQELLPKINGSLIFMDNAKIIKNVFKKCGIVGADHDFENVDIHKTKEPFVYSTSALREGVSVNNPNFKACIVDYKQCRLWSTKDVIQGVNRIRGKDVLRIFTNKPKEQYNKEIDFDWYLKIAKGEVREQYINAVLGEFYDDFIKYTQKTSNYQDFSEYGLVCFLSKITRNNYDERLYEWQELTPGELLELDLTIEDDEVEQEELFETYKTSDKRTFKYNVKYKNDFMRWIQLYEAGTITKFMKLKEFKNLNDIYRLSAVSRAIREKYNMRNKKFGKKYSIDMFFDLMRNNVVIEVVDRDNKEVKRIGTKTLLRDLYIRVIGECSVKGVEEVKEGVELPIN